MNRFIVLLLVGFLLSFGSYANERCPDATGNALDQIQALSATALEITAKLPASQSVLKVKASKFFANHGNGDVFVLTDEAGNITGVRVDFKINGRKNETLFKTFQEIDKGEELKYFEEDASTPALIVKKANRAKINSATGGEFVFSILTRKPDTYQDYSLKLTKLDGKWKLKDKEEHTLTTVDITPNVDFAQWAGTFSKATFK